MTFRNEFLVYHSKTHFSSRMEITLRGSSTKIKSAVAKSFCTFYTHEVLRYLAWNEIAYVTWSCRY